MKDCLRAKKIIERICFKKTIYYNLFGKIGKHLIL